MAKDVFAGLCKCLPRGEKKNSNDLTKCYMKSLTLHSCLCIDDGQLTPLKICSGVGETLMDCYDLKGIWPWGLVKLMN